MDESAETKILEAAHMAAISHEATSVAREAQMHESLVKAFKEVFTAGANDNAPMLLQRVPFICKDIRDMKNDMRWIKYIGGGFVTAAGLLALKSLGL